MNDDPQTPLENVIGRARASARTSRRLTARALERIATSHKRLELRQQEFETLGAGLKDEEWQDAAETRQAEADQHAVEREVRLTMRSVRDGQARPRGPERPR